MGPDVHLVVYPINQRKGYLVKIKNDGSYVSTTTWYNAADTRVKDFTIDLSNNISAHPINHQSFSKSSFT